MVVCCCLVTRSIFLWGKRLPAGLGFDHAAVMVVVFFWLLIVAFLAVFTHTRFWRTFLRRHVLDVFLSRSISFRCRSLRHVTEWYTAVAAVAVVVPGGGVHGGIFLEFSSPCNCWNCLHVIAAVFARF